MESFNIQYFNANETSGSYCFTTSNGDNVQQFRGSNNVGFIERITNNSSPYGSYKEFSDSGKLIRQGQTFFGFFTGVHNVYNQNGDLVNTIDFEIPFAFSINSLINEINSQYQINILDTASGIQVSRSADPTPQYRIAIPLIFGDAESNHRILVIDATNGNVISDTIRIYTK